MIESLKNNQKGILIMLCSSIFACVGQLFWKISATEGILWAILGLGFYGIGALFMLTAYKFGKVSVLQPVLSMNYVLSIVLGALILKETVTILKVIGVCIIMAGVVMIGGSDNE